jgi:signal transduction histidine kinase
LEREQHARAQQARIEERARIAHEMHDILAHQVALVVLHAGALEVTSEDPATVAAAVLIRETGRQALADLRQVLGVLRSEPTAGPGTPGRQDPASAPPPGFADLDRLLASTRAAGIPVVRRDEGVPRPLPAAVDRAAYRVIQEALTNVARYAGPAPTTVRIVHRPDSLEITVRNDRPSTQPAGGTGAGLGLIGLRERVTLLGGRCQAGPTHDGGFAVHATLPSRANPERSEPTRPSPTGEQP